MIEKRLIMKIYNKNAWTIIQTMLIAAVIALFLAFSLPGILSSRVSGNESRVKKRLKSLAKKLQTYKFNSKIDSYPADLSFMRGDHLGSSRKRPFAVGELSFEYSGYWFIYMPAAKDALINVDKYTFFCKPVKPNISGNNSFVMNEGATVYLDVGKSHGAVDEFDRPVK